ncbi:VanZ family protein [Flavobacterium sp.]|uniref:VanZ family protein n=1 Tax=Flavobacterium sp. TaxID=239 RepID=UPI001213DFD5|nr:VanZ family protein [Flavobacterium sp.]RZJ73969.1 MAG: VanZ family protein [Flavobacterium sp.]
MRKKLWLVAASLWTIFLIVLCLVNFNNLPTVSVSNFDKYAHASFHFIFTILWYMYLRVEDRKVSNAQLLLKIVSASLFLGIGLEIGQAFTLTRSPDFADALANLSGAIIGALVLFAHRRWINKP